MPSDARSVSRMDVMQMSEFEKIALETGKLVTSKNAAYGSAFEKSGEFLKLLFPDGVPVEKYPFMLTAVRIFDKLMREATNPDAFDENPAQDVTGYGLLWQKSKRDQKSRR